MSVGLPHRQGHSLEGVNHLLSEDGRWSWSRRSSEALDLLQPTKSVRGELQRPFASRSQEREPISQYRTLGSHPPPRRRRKAQSENIPRITSWTGSQRSAR